MAIKAIKQNTFSWEGVDKRGKIVKGEINGASIAIAKAMLRRQGVNPTKVRKKAQPLFGGLGGKKITAKDISIFSRQLSTMMNAGVPLVQSFDIIGRGHSNPAMRDLMNNIKTDVESGSNLSDALRKHPLQFDELYCNLINAGEHAGILDNILDEIANYKEKTEAIKAKVKKALVYPSAVLVVAFVIAAFLLIKIVPQFASMFKGMGAELPVATQIVMSMSDFFRAYWMFIFGGIFAAVYGFIFTHKRSKSFRHSLDRLLLKVPVIGSILTKAAIARYSRTLATMFTAGVPLVEAMDSVAGAVGNVVYSDAVLKMRDEVATGTQLNAAMRQTKLFPNMVVQMTAIGEEAGSIDTMLGKVADFYEEEVDNAVDSLSSLIEPIVMVVLGVMVGGLLIAMYMPIFQVGDVMSGK